MARLEIQVPNGNINTISGQNNDYDAVSLRTNQPRIDLPKRPRTKYLRCASQKARSHHYRG